MSFSAADSKIFGSLFADKEITAVYADEQFIQEMVRFEVGLATVQSRLGIIPTAAAAKIEAAAPTFRVDFAQLQRDTEKAGVPVIGLLRQLRAHVDHDAADYLHWGATTQDVMDTAVILQTRTALELIEIQLSTVCQNLAHLADRHRHTVMAGRTHSQQALPIPFGLKVAGWLAPLLRHRQRLAELKPRLLVLQLGGAAGTLAAMGEWGTAVQENLAAELNLNLPLMPWHTQRDNLAEFASWLSLVSGSLAKMAQDIILLAQTEIGELRETADRSRGGSSTMPQKHNPIISEQIIAAARSNASLLATMHQAQIQEHERGTHGWQMEWFTLPQMVGLTAVSLKKAAFLSQNLVVNAGQMRANVTTSSGLMLAEAISFALATHMSRPAAKKLVAKACQIAQQEQRHLIDVVQEQTNALIDWEALRDEANYLGASDKFIDAVLQDFEQFT